VCQITRSVARCGNDQMAECSLLCREGTHQPAAGIGLLSPEQDARVTAPSPWMFVAPPMAQAVWASSKTFSGRFASTVIEDVA
jgi:hypothetical protein